MTDEIDEYEQELIDEYHEYGIWKLIEKLEEKKDKGTE